MEGAFFLTNWFLEGMKWIFQNVAFQHTVLTIIICTLVLKGVTLFSDIKTRKSTAKMSALQPELDKINSKYRDNPQKLQIEQRKLMKTAGVSMWSSCLPMLITLPLFICFFNAFRYWGHEQMVELLLTANSDMDAAKEMFLSFKFLWVNNIWQADNGMSPVIMGAQSFLQTADLPRLLLFKSNPEMLTVFENLGMAVRSSLVVDGEVQTVWNFIASQGAIAKYNELTAPLSELYAGYNNGWFLLPLLAGGSMFLAPKLTQPNQKAAGQPASQQQQSGKMMMYIFPVISFIACLSNNAAFAIYWLLSNVIMIAINLILNKKYPRVAIADVKGGK